MVSLFILTLSCAGNSPKYKVGDCFKFIHNDHNTFKISYVNTYRYVVNDNKYLSIKFVDNMTNKVKCVDIF